MPKDKSSFDDIFDARRKAKPPTGSQASSHLVSETPTDVTKKRGKYDDPDYTRVTFYIRKDVDMQVRHKLVAQGKRELSDVFQRLAEGWIGGRFEV